MSYRLMHLYQRLRRLKYKLLSNNSIVQGNPVRHQPVHFVGKGSIKFHGTAHLGVFPSPFFLSGYIYMEARSPQSVIEIEDGVWMNNNTFLISDGPGIFIGKNTLIGSHCEIMDSDFHGLQPDRRSAAAAKTGKVVIGENVLIGSNVKILRGVRIGNNAIIANGTVVTRSIPADLVVYGNPAKVGIPIVTGTSQKIES